MINTNADNKVVKISYYSNEETFTINMYDFLAQNIDGLLNQEKNNIKKLNVGGVTKFGVHADICFVKRVK
jgi:hypothetical protein|tara:strand:- start:214 stop:423 length:210 start_codon:yes stop_codon:yes gene_type:complete